MSALSVFDTAILLRSIEFSTNYIDKVTPGYCKLQSVVIIATKKHRYYR